MGKDKDNKGKAKQLLKLKDKTREEERKIFS